MSNLSTRTYKITGRIFASLLSVILVMLLIVAPFCGATQTMITVETITEIIKEIPYEEIIDTNTTFGNDETQISAESYKKTVDALLDTEAFQEIFALYLDNVVASLTDTDTKEYFTPESVQEILQEHTDTIADVIAKQNPELSVEQIEEELDIMIDQRLPGLIEQVPAPETVKELIDVPVYGTVLKNIVSSGIVGILWGVIVVLAALILLCRLYHWQGVKWLGIDALIASLFLIVSALGLQSGGLSGLEETAFLLSAITVLGGQLLTSGIVMAVCGLLLTGVGIALRLMYSSSNTSTRTFTKKHLQQLTITAILIALACIGKIFQISVPVAGVAGMHISFAGIFSILPALLFGPVYGGATGGIVDVLGYLLTGGRDGAFVPWITLTAILGGVLKGLLWGAFLKLSSEQFRKRAVFVLLAVLGAMDLTGLFNLLCVSFWPDFAWTNILALLKSKVSFVTYGLIIISAVGLLCILSAKYMGKVIPKMKDSKVLPLLGTIGIPNLLVTTLNTFIIMDLYKVKSAFWVFYTPRLIEELIMIVVETLLISWLLGLIRNIGGSAISKERM